MPPILGASAFVMAELTGINYFNICVAAAIPAIIYFLSLSINVELRARKMRLMPVERIPVDVNKLLYCESVLILRVPDRR